MNLVLITILIGQLSATSYRSVPAQTDDSPFITSIGERVHKHGIAISRDLLRRNGGPLNYGDWVYIEKIGFKVVFDCMHERHKNSIDIWVASLDEERAFHKKFKGQKLKVWVVMPVFKGSTSNEKEDSKS